MKKFKKVLAVLTFLLVVLCGSVAGTEVSAVSEVRIDGDYEYEILKDGTVSITKYKGMNEHVDIPDKLAGKKVTAIEGKKVGAYNEFLYESCFKYNKKIKSVSIPDSVTKIGTAAFWQCPNLISVTIPDSVKEIGSYAFRHCNSLASIKIPNSVTEIGSNVFDYCENLKSANIPKRVSTINVGVFQGCKSLTSVIIPKGVTKIEAGAFNGCKCLNHVYFTGSENDWNEIDISDYNDYLKNVRIEYDYEAEGYEDDTSIVWIFVLLAFLVVGAVITVIVLKRKNNE